jgi:hypothetical protein
MVKLPRAWIAVPKISVMWQNLLGGASIELSPADLQKIQEAAAKIEVQGARYPAQLQQLVGK